MFLDVEYSGGRSDTGAAGVVRGCPDLQKEDGQSVESVDRAVAIQVPNVLGTAIDFVAIQRDTRIGIRIEAIHRLEKDQEVVAVHVSVAVEVTKDRAADVAPVGVCAD